MYEWGRRRVEVEVIFFYVFAVVPFAVGQPEQPLLEDGVFTVPQRKRKAEVLTIVGDARQAVFSPVIRARARLVVAEVVPRIARIAVVLSDRSPLPLAQVGPPLLPGSFLFTSFSKS